MSPLYRKRQELWDHWMSLPEHDKLHIASAGFAFIFGYGQRSDDETARAFFEQIEFLVTDAEARMAANPP